ncbi:peptide chain release factor N(5)-glutamine methyltransferase [Fervidobacterium sp.]
MTFSEIIKIYTEKGLPEREALLLIGKVIKQKKEYIIAHRYDECPKEYLEYIFELFEKRFNGYPLQYILGEVEFYGRMFYIEEGVLIPRWETEGLIDICKEYVRRYDLKNIIDIGVGSGVIAITIALECNNVRVYGTDISEKAIALSQRNANRYGANCTFKCGEFAEPFLDLFDTIQLIVSNPPYVRTDAKLQKELNYEPREALFSGEDGLNFYRELFKRYNLEGKIVVMEIGDDQGEYLKNLTGGHILKDLSGKDRYLVVDKFWVV